MYISISLDSILDKEANVVSGRSYLFSREKENLLEVVLDVGVRAVGVADEVLCGVEGAGAALGVEGGGDEAAGVGAVAGGLPEHGAAEALALEVGDLALDHVDVVVADELLGGGVVAVAGARGVVVRLRRARLGQHLVVPDALLPRALADARVRLADAVGGLEGAPVQRDAHDDLAGGHAAGDVGADGGFGGERGGYRVLAVGVQVRLVARSGVPRSGVVVGHQVEVIKKTGHFAKVELLVVGGAGGHGGSQEEMVAAGVLGRVRVEFRSDSLQKENHVAGLGIVGRVLPVDVETVKTPVLH